MDYYIQLKDITKRNNMHIVNERDEEVGRITFLKKKGEKNLEITDLTTMTKYEITSNPLKRKKRFIIHDQAAKELARIQVGYKIIHSILEHGDYFFVKSALLKVKFRMFLKTDIVTSLDVVRKNNERYYKISSTDDDFVKIIALFLLARAVRLKALL